MKKFFLSAVVVLLAVALSFWFLKAPVMSMYLSRLLKTNVSIGSIEISRSHMKIKNLKIHNPSGFNNVSAFTCKEMNISYDWKQATSNISVIERIDLSDNYLRVECVNDLCTDNNWTKIMKNIGEKEAREKNREVIVKKMTMKGLQVDIQGMGGVLSLMAKKNTNIDYIEFNNVSSKEGFPTNELIAAIFKQAGIFDFIKGIIDPRKIFDDYFKSLNPFGQSEKLNLDAAHPSNEPL